MRLINTKTLELHEFWGDRIPKYAILSHTWEKDEVTFQDWSSWTITKRKKKKGYFKIEMACRQAQKHDLKYLWVDTNCIDKSSSAELSEAINSMFSWYQKAYICYVYLSDVGPMPDEWDQMTSDYVRHFRQSKWFTRGWTLQELTAPTRMTFYSRNWSKIASRATMEEVISQRTEISCRYLRGDGRYKEASIAQKMSWVSRRSTTRIEDMAYCMLGIFNINMPLLYGEGPKSFTRLQEEIIRTSNDQTVFCWTWIDSVPLEWVSLLAPCPQAFKYSKEFVSADDVIKDIELTYEMTNAGLSITLPIVQAWGYYLGILNAQDKRRNPAGSFDHLVCVPIQGDLHKDSTSWRQGMRRLPFPPGPVSISTEWALCQSHMYIRSNPGPPASSWLIPTTRAWPHAGSTLKYQFLLVFGNTEELLDEKPHPDTIRSEITPGTRVCLMEHIRPRIKLDFFPPDSFDEERSLITVDRTSLPTGFVVRIGMTHPRFLFVGIGTRSQEWYPPSHELYRVCNVLPDSVLKEFSTYEELLARQLESTKEKGEKCEESSRDGIRIIMREETVTEDNLICLTYISCQENHVVKLDLGDGSDTRSDVDMKGGHDHEREGESGVPMTGLLNNMNKH